MKIKPNYSTAAAQTGLFYQVQSEIAQTNAQRMVALEISRLEHALEDSRNYPVAYPILVKHGFMERTPDGFRSISPEAVVSRCRELLAKLYHT